MFIYWAIYPFHNQTSKKKPTLKVIVGVWFCMIRLEFLAFFYWQTIITASFTASKWAYSAKIVTFELLLTMVVEGLK